VTTRRQLAQFLQERERRIARAPLAYLRLWDNDEPLTSQRRALLDIALDGLEVLDIGGGNRTGKSLLLAAWLTACAGGLDAWVPTPQGRLYWVRKFLELNELPTTVIPGGRRALPPALVWAASATNGASVDQIRPHIRALCPEGTVFSGWFSGTAQGTAVLPNTGGRGLLKTKTYREYLKDNQTWEGAAVRAVGCDEEPPAGAVLAGISRLVDLEGRLMVALTALTGTTSDYYQKIEKPAPPWYKKTCLYGEHNPHISQEKRRSMVATMPAWQKAARDKGERVDPVGRIWPWDANVHEIEPFEVPPGWMRWVGVDWGGRAPHVLWVAEEPGGDGRLILYRELAPRRKTEEPGVSDRELIEEAKRLEAEEYQPAIEAALKAAKKAPRRGVIYRVADSENPGGITEANRQGYLMAAAKKGAGSIAEGLRTIESMLAVAHPISGESQKPRIVAMRGRCPVTVEEIRGLKWAETKPGRKPQPDPRCPDHGPDALRYIMKRRQQLGYR